MPNGRNGGKRRSGRQKRNKHEKGGRTVKTAASALFAFMGSASSSGGLLVWRWASAPPRFGSGCFRIGQRKPIIRTHLLSEKGSDYMGLVPVAGLEPARYRYQWILSPSRLPIPSHRRIVQLLYTRLPEKASTFSEIAPAKPRRPPKASAKKRPGCAVPPLSKRTSKSYRPVYGPRPCQNCS